MSNREIDILTETHIVTSLGTPEFEVFCQSHNSCTGHDLDFRSYIAMTGIRIISCLLFYKGEKGKRMLDTTEKLIDFLAFLSV